MPDHSAGRVKAREQVEAELLEILRQRQHEWRTAPEDQRDYARQRFMNASQNFNSVILYGKTSGGRGKITARAARAGAIVETQYAGPDCRP
jgi:hypothetical protein